MPPESRTTDPADTKLFRDPCSSRSEFGQWVLRTGASTLRYGVAGSLKLQRHNVAVLQRCSVPVLRFTGTRRAGLLRPARKCT